MKHFLSLAAFLLLLNATVAAQTSIEHAGPAITTEKLSYQPGETVGFVGTNWAPGEAVRIVISGPPGTTWPTLLATADDSGSFRVTTEMPEGPEIGEHHPIAMSEESEEGAAHEGTYRATATGSLPTRTADTEVVQGREKSDGERMLDEEIHWATRQTYPTYKFNPEWVRKAADQDARIERRTPRGANVKTTNDRLKINPLSLSNLGFTALGPQPEHMTGCSGCFDYGLTAGRINDLKVDPTTTTQGSIVAYGASVGGGVWKTTNCCSPATTWAVTTDDPLISTTSIDSITIDPNNHNTIYAGTGDLNYGSFSMGSQGILKSTDAGAHWTVLGASVFGSELPEPAGKFPQYQSVGKVRVDPNNSNNVVAGTKTGLFFSYDAGANWSGPCLTNGFNTMRQDITALELSNMGGGVTRIIAAVGVRGFASAVQYNLDQNGANGIYKATMGPSGCPSFTSIASNANGFVFGTAVTGSPFTTGAAMNAGSGTIYSSPTVGDQLGRIEIGIAPTDPNTIYVQVQSIAPNNNSGGNASCGNTNGCQLGIWASTNGGTTWTFMTGSGGGSLQTCTATAGDYPQNWYDQALAVDPNNASRVFISTYDVYFATLTGTALFDLTCGYSGGSVVHTDQHALAFVPGSSSILLLGNDGGVDFTANADTTTATVRPTFTNMDTGLNTIEFYSGDISANFATSSRPQIDGGAQDNGPSSATFSGTPTGPVQWQMGTGGDGFYARIDPVGTGTSSATGTITLTTGGAVAGETFVIGPQTFTFQTAARSGTGQVTLNSSTTTEGNNIVTAITADIPAIATAVRSGATVVVTAVTPGAAGNSIAFTESSTNFTMDGAGLLGGTFQGGFPSLRFWEGNNSGGLSRCITNCTAAGATWTSKRGNWTSDTQAFQLPFDIFHGGIPGGDDCPAAAAGGGCGHMLAGTTRVWETITANASGSGGAVNWYVNSPPNVSKQTLGNRSYINQVKLSPKYESVAMLGTNDANVLIGFGLGSGSGPTAASGTITVSGTPVAGQTFTVASQTFTWAATRTVTGTVAISATTTTAATNIVTAITADLAGTVTAARSGSVVTVTAVTLGAAGNSIVLANVNSTGITMSGSGTLAGGSNGVAVWVDVTGGNSVVPNRPVLGIALDPSATSASLPVGYAAVGGYNDLTPGTPGHLFRIDCTANCGSFTWTDKSGNLPNIPADSVIVNPNYANQVFAGTDFGLYYTDDITANPPVWYRFTSGLPNVMVWDMTIDRGSTTLALWTRSRGAYVWPLPAGPLAPLTTSMVDGTASSTYGGAPINLSATLTSGGNPVSGKSVAFTLVGNGVGSATTGVNGLATLSNVSITSLSAGTYPNGIGASFSGDSTYATITTTNSLTLAKASSMVNATGGTFTYNGSGHAGSGTATGGEGESLASSLSYSGTGTTTYGPSATAPSGAGTYQVVVHTNGDGNNNAGDSSPAAITINKANPTVTATGGSFTYSGNPQAGSGSATGGAAESLSVTLSYTGTGTTTYGPSATAPSLVGTYQVVANTTGDANNNSGTSSPSALSINKAAPAVNATGGTFTYDGTAHAGSGSATGGAGETLSVTLSYSGTGATTYGPSATAPTNAGTYLVTAQTAGDSNNNSGTSSGTALTINKANATMTSTGGTFTYNGSAHAGSGSATGGAGETLTVTLSYSGTGATTYGPSATAPTNAGTYLVAAQTAGDGNNNSGTSSGAALTINKANATVNATGGTFAYNASPRTGGGSATGGGGETLSLTLSYSGTGTTTYGPSATAPANAGTYQVVAQTTGDGNNNGGTSSPAALTINKATATIVVTGYCAAFDGAAHTAGGTATGVVSESLTGLVLGGTAHTAAGTYLGDGWTFTNANYSNASGSVNDAIVDATITAPATTVSGASRTASVTDAGAGATYAWSITGGTITAGSGTRNVTFTAGAGTTVALHVTVTTTTSCTDTKSANVALTHFDPNGDATIDPSDIFYLVNYLFTGGPAPAGTAGMISGDANGDSVVDPSDIFFLINYLFETGPHPFSAPRPGVKTTAVSSSAGQRNVDEGIRHDANYAAPVIGTSPAGSPGAGHIAGRITLGQGFRRDGKYIVPVIVTAAPGSMTPEALSLKVRFTADLPMVTTSIHRAGAARDLVPSFEVSRQVAVDDLSYLVSFDPQNGALVLDGERSAVVAEIEIDAPEQAAIAISFDPRVTMLSDHDGSHKATVANGSLQLSAATGRDGRPQPPADAHVVNE